MKIYICSIEGLADAASYDAASLKIDSYRKEKLGCIKSEKDRLRSLCAGLLINYAVAEYKRERDVSLEEKELVIREIVLQELLNAEKQVYEYKQEAKGKPYIADVPGFYFSLSHSGDYVLCAWDIYEIGADLQCMDREIKDTLAKKVMTEKEYIKYMELPLPDRQKEFYRVWAVKESYSKLTGKGLSQNFGEIEADKIHCDTKMIKEKYWLAVSRYD